jgi:hypothetical protein
MLDATAQGPCVKALIAGLVPRLGELGDLGREIGVRPQTATNADRTRRRQVPRVCNLDLLPGSSTGCDVSKGSPRVGGENTMQPAEPPSKRTTKSVRPMS